MDAPKCKICGEMHYGLCPSFKATTSPSPRAKSVSSKPAKDRSTTHSSEKAGSVAPEVLQPRFPGFDRIAYQRDYMRNVYRPKHRERRARMKDDK